MFGMWKAGPKPNKRILRDLRETENLLLDAYRAKEDAEGHVSILENRVRRLRAMLRQPAPTQELDGVTSGDITLIQDPSPLPGTIASISNSARKHHA